MRLERVECPDENDSPTIKDQPHSDKKSKSGAKVITLADLKK
jgi:hypothetical protein